MQQLSGLQIDQLRKSCNSAAPSRNVGTENLDSVSVPSTEFAGYTIPSVSGQSPFLDLAQSDIAPELSSQIGRSHIEEPPGELPSWATSQFVRQMLRESDTTTLPVRLQRYVRTHSAISS